MQHQITDVIVKSAGFKANSNLSAFSDIHFDRMNELNISTNGFVRTQFKQEFLDDYDLVIAMGIEHKEYVRKEFNRNVILFNELLKNEETSLIVPPPDKDGIYLIKIKEMVDYINDAIPSIFSNIREKIEIKEAATKVRK
jgi:protein-tyrosine-phosphatase